MTFLHRCRRILLPIALSGALLAGPAQAAEVVRDTTTAEISKSMDEVADALLAYEKWCDKGCRYRSPGVVVDKRLKHFASKSRFYTWTHISNVKDTRYFSEVRLVRGKDKVTMKTRSLTGADRARVEELEKLTGLKHNPIFKATENTVTLKAKTKAGKPVTSFRSETSVTVGGLLSLFAGRVKSGLRDSMKATIAALRS